MLDLNEFDIDCSNVIKPVYDKRYNKSGQEYLEQVDEVNIEDDLLEKQLEINRIKEIMNTQERVKAEDLLNQMTAEDLAQIESLSELNELDTYEFLNKTNELKKIYNKMPESVKENYNNLSKFSREYLPVFIDEQRARLEKQKNDQQSLLKQEQASQTFEDLQKQITELQNKLKGENENV